MFPRQGALFYEQLGRQLEAGLPLAVSLGHLHAGQKSGTLRQVLADARKSVENGDALTLALDRYPEVFPSHEVRFLQAAETAGHLPAACARLAVAYRQRHQRAMKLATSLVYPLGLLLASVMLAPLKHLFLGEVGTYLVIVIPLLGVTLGAIAGAAYTAYVPSARPLRLVLLQLALRVPGLRGLVEVVGLARLGHLLAVCFTAALPHETTFRIAADATPEPGLAAALRKVADEIGRGQTLGALLDAAPTDFPLVLRQIVNSGEASGTLDTQVAKAAVLWEEDAQRTLDLGVKALSGALSMVAMFVVISAIFGEASAYLKQIDDLIK